MARLRAASSSPHAAGRPYYALHASARNKGLCPHSDNHQLRWWMCSLFHSKTHRALILLLLASKPDPLLGSGLGPPLRGSFFLSQGNIDFNRLQMDITQAPAFLKAALPSGCGCDVKTEPEIQGTSSLAIRLFCSLIWPCVFDTQLLIIWLLHRIEKMNVQAA